MEAGTASTRAARFGGLGFLLGAAVAVFAGVLRFLRLNIPRELIPLDEFYYPVNALGLLRHGADYQLAEGASLPGACSQIGIEPAFAVHPPVGKWLIGAGMRIFGCNSFGWRVAAALLGTASVLLVYLIARRLFRSPWIAALAGVLVAVDGLHFVQSRIAMLDIFLTFFIVLAIWLLVEDRARAGPDYAGIRWWRLGSGVAIGLATATKWSGAFFIPVLAILAIVFEVVRRRAGRPEPVPPAPPEEPAEPPQPATGGEWGQGFGPGGPPPPDGSDEEEDQDDEPSEGEEPAGAPVPPWGGHEEVPLSSDLVPASRPFESLGAHVGRVLLAFSIVPLFVYVLSYIPWFYADGERYKPPRCAEQDAIHFDGFVSPVNSKLWNWDGWPAEWREWVCYQREIWDFHKNLKTINEDGKPTHPYLSRAWSWPWMGRPTSHFFRSRGFGLPCEGRAAVAAPRVRVAQISPTSTETPATTTESPPATTTESPPATQTPGATESPTPAPEPVDPQRECKTQAEILGLPNPAMWIPAFFLAIPFAIYRALGRGRDAIIALLLLLIFFPLALVWLLRRQGRGDGVAGLLLFLFFVPLFLPWLVATRPLFLFYMTPAVPILALLVAHLVDRVTDEMQPVSQTLWFAFLFTAWSAPLWINWLHAGTTAQLLYKVPAMGVLYLVAAGLATLFAFGAKPRRIVAAYAGLVMLVFAYFYPVLSAVYIPDEGMFGWRKHMWLQRDCGQEGILLTCWI